MGFLPLTATALAVVAVAAGCGDRSSDTAGAPEDRGRDESAVVRSVTDGDTLRLRDGRRVRLAQIDAPEESSECFGRGATAALARLTRRGATIVLRTDPLLDSRDEHGRLLRYVFRDGLNVNVELVRLGAAVPYFFRRARGVHAGRLLDAARDARRQRRGLWSACPGAMLDPDRGALTGRG